MRTFWCSLGTHTLPLRWPRGEDAMHQPTPPAPAIARQHLLLAAGAVVLIGIGMGGFLTWVSNTPRRGSHTPDQQDEELQARRDSPQVELKKVFNDSLADFGELLPEPVFPPKQKPES